MTAYEVQCVAQRISFVPIPEGPMPDHDSPGEWRGNVLGLRDIAFAGAWASQPMVVEMISRGEVEGEDDPDAIVPESDDDVPTIADYVDSLPYGYAAAVGPLACISQEIGMSCWNVTTKHGFFLARERYVIW